MKENKEEIIIAMDEIKVIQCVYGPPPDRKEDCDEQEDH